MSIFNQSAAAYTGALGAANRVANMGFGAPQINPARARSFGMGAAPQLANTNIRQYMNPYTNNVINRAQMDMNRSRQMALNDVGAQATAAGAFGGSRHGLVEAETNRGFADAAADMSAGLRQDGFNNAQQMAMGDIGNRMAAAQFNAGQRQQTSQYNAGNRMAANLNNASNALQAQQMQGTHGLASAAQLGSLSNLGFGMGNQINQSLGQAGAEQQSINQALINAAKGQYAGWSGAPMAGLQAMIGATSGAPVPQSQTTKSNPGIFDFLTAGAGILGAFCWVSRAAFGSESGEWLKVRQWMLTKAPKWLFDAYVKHGPALAGWIERHPVTKPLFRMALRRMVSGGR